MRRALLRYRLDDDRPNPETSLERLIRQALDQAGYTYTDQGRIGRYRPDFIVTLPDGTRVVIECDGPHHQQSTQQRKDRRKDAAYKAAGYRVFRFTQQEIKHSPVACIQRIWHD
jgi:very-short-patch-repair endonuclease